MKFHLYSFDKYHRRIMLRKKVISFNVQEVEKRVLAKDLLSELDKCDSLSETIIQQIKEFGLPFTTTRIKEAFANGHLKDFLQQRIKSLKQQTASSLAQEEVVDSDLLSLKSQKMEQVLEQIIASQELRDKLLLFPKFTRDLLIKLREEYCSRYHYSNYGLKELLDKGLGILFTRNLNIIHDASGFSSSWKYYFLGVPFIPEQTRGMFFGQYFLMDEEEL
ncbi:hypothetical protein A2526_03255 [candidate division WOR-1 bacterium RIFOXYD2_FULL_36_8]|nr:MAG: hypothetical protein A2282_08655 [candidate division WOR-1 bacterium RIFOXYA12_FULL_36_13]OGC41281.1 MAG: hypothetical protein A2526_03255 [candidate division WOR-1 bacterium RIFOXYD2_FULL_36_8]